MVPDFSDHDFIGVLSQDGAKRVGKRETHFRVDLDLLNQVHPILYRIFDRNNLVLNITQLVKCAV